MQLPCSNQDTMQWPAVSAAYSCGFETNTVTDLTQIGEICFMEKLITRKEAAEILVSAFCNLWTRPVTQWSYFLCAICTQNGCVLYFSGRFRSISQNAHRAKPDPERTQLIVNLAEAGCEPVRILAVNGMV